MYVCHYIAGVQLFPLHNAVASKNFKHVQDLVDDGHDINEQHYDRVTPLHMACLTGDQHITRYLLEHGAWVRRRPNRGRQGRAGQGCNTVFSYKYAASHFMRKPV